MNGELLIDATDVGLEYRLSKSSYGTLKEFAISALKRQVKYDSLWALKDVSLQVHRGHVLGIIGPNGGGKSTLLKILARVIPPTKGRVIVRGDVAPMIELGAGFNGDLTGFENIVMYGALLGRDVDYMKESAPGIAEWAGVADFLNVPLRSYSSGMLARLGFAVATDITPDVLIIDEVLSVGDEAFQAQSLDRMLELIESGTAVVFVSHDLSAMRRIATEVMWLDHGSIVTVGDPHEICASYEDSVESSEI